MSKIEEGHAVKAEEIVIHEHVLTPFQKLICVAEMVFMAWLLSICGRAVVSHVQHLMHILH